ncbi:hypothetical protein J2W55_002879 [Mucilaginibacter pocheonensis]|uniref:HemN C-terminal domain-containing protein n=2 Tax=Mucilaginibacter pocheonensis TaxID=398050 RepID=A0ABU1TCB1_9SPHI|nr:hypothetical protein [Mucilaginibacter pocheonensis]
MAHFFGKYYSFTSFQRNMSIRIDLVPSYIDNLCRLGILEKLLDSWVATPNIYDQLTEDSLLDDIKKEIIQSGNTLKYNKGLIQLTMFGRQFIDNVVKEI